MAKSTKLKSVPKAQPVYDPNKKYLLNPEDYYAIKGSYLDIINKVIQTGLQNPDIQRALLFVEGARTLQEVIKEAVEEGVINEAPEQKGDLSATEISAGDQSK